MKVQIKEQESGYQFQYPNGVNDIRIVVEAQKEHYVFKQMYNNLNSGDGGDKEKVARIIAKKFVNNPKDMALRVLQDVLISEILPKYESLEFEILKLCKTSKSVTSITKLVT